MKVLTILGNILAISSAIYLYINFSIIEPLAIGGLMLLSLIAITGFTNKGLALVFLILSVCTTCGSFILVGIIIFGDALAGYPLSLLLSLSIIAAYLIVIVLNILALKTPAGIQKAK